MHLGHLGHQLCSGGGVGGGGLGLQDLQLRWEADAVAADRHGGVPLAAGGHDGACRAGRGGLCGGAIAGVVMVGVKRGREIQSGRRCAQEVVWW